MYFVYSLLLTLGFIILLPRFAIDALRSGKYVTGLGQRLGNLPTIKSDGRPIVWLHCVSVGEAQAAQSLVRALRGRFPNLALVVSTTTVTGQQVATEIFRDAAGVFYFPIDWRWTVRRVIRKLRPAAIVVMETELWPNLFRYAKKLEIPVAVLNGRISDKSFRRYQLVRPFIRRVLADLSLAAMQSEQDAERIQNLGLPADRTHTAGNLKFDSASVASNGELIDELRRQFGFTNDRPLIVAASTHEPEETICLSAFRELRQSQPAARLLVAPRHPDRFNDVADLLSNSGFAFARRSAAPSPEDLSADLVLLDSIGELRAVYPLATVAFVGGSIAAHGGHSVIEPAADGVCTITGPHMQNFAAVTKALRDQDALIELRLTGEPAAELAQVISEMLADERRRTAIGQRAKRVCDENRGATERTLDLISPILRTPDGAEEAIPISSLQAAATK